MKDTSTLISGIYYKIKLLVERNAVLTKEIESLEHQNTKLKGELKVQHERLKNLKLENDAIKISKTISSDEDREKTRFVIEGLVQEIDKSLNLLNK